MLLISIPSTVRSGITFTGFKRVEIPKPINGYAAEINNDLILKFEDEEQAIDYANKLRELVTDQGEQYTIEREIINDIIDVISTNRFVQSYLGNA